VNPPEQQAAAGSPLTSSRDGLFSAYTNEQRQRVGRRQVLTLAGVLGLFGVLAYAVVTFQPDARPFRVDTWRGLRRVVQGMTPQEVSGILGQPIGREQRGEQECFQYGRPSLKEASFVLHTLCYVDGKLQDVSARRYNSWVVTREGAVSPAPLEDEQPPPEPQDPGLAGGTPP
jgi:hypothetical protein